MKLKTERPPCDDCCLVVCCLLHPAVSMDNCHMHTQYLLHQLKSSYCILCDLPHALWRLSAGMI